MPIQLSCQCGQNLKVPDAMAGKVGKCPKCQKPIKIPAAGSGGSAPAAAKPSQSGAKPAAASAKPAAASAKTTAKPAVAASVASAQANPFADLFDSAGLKQREGLFCPSCDAASPPGSAICVKCGFHFNEGTKIEGHQVAVKKQFGNKQLNEAVLMMEREADSEKRLLGAGAPWWMMFAMLTGLVVMIGGILIKMDASTSGNVSNIPLFARIQKADFLSVLAASTGLGLYLVALFANFAILISAFKESVSQGLLCMFAPFYILYYMFSRITTRRLLNTVIILWVCSILSGIMLGYALPRI